MRNRAIQLVMVGLVGAFLAWWLRRGDEPQPAAAPVSMQPAPSVVPPSLQAAAPPSDAPTTFHLPKVASPVREVPPPAPPPPPSSTIRIPNDWALRGSGVRNYELRSDGQSVFTGSYSALLASHEKEIQPNLFGSGVQVIYAGRYASTRVQLSAMLRSEGMQAGRGGLWMYIADPGRVVVAYQMAEVVPERDAGEWTRYRVVMDVPWHAELIGYGFTLQGRGKLWMDDVHFEPVDVNVPLTGQPDRQKSGVVAQAISTNGALANPTNLDFEDVVVTRNRQGDGPPDAINNTRF